MVSSAAIPYHFAQLFYNQNSPLTTQHISDSTSEPCDESLLLRTAEQNKASSQTGKYRTGTELLVQTEIVGLWDDIMEAGSCAAQLCAECIHSQPSTHVMSTQKIQLADSMWMQHHIYVKVEIR